MANLGPNLKSSGSNFYAQLNSAVSERWWESYKTQRERGIQTEASENVSSKVWLTNQLPLLTHSSLNHQSTRRLKGLTCDPEFKKSQVSRNLGVSERTQNWVKQSKWSRNWLWD